MGLQPFVTTSPCPRRPGTRTCTSSEQRRRLPRLATPPFTVLCPARPHDRLAARWNVLPTPTRGWPPVRGRPPVWPLPPIQPYLLLRCRLARSAESRHLRQTRAQVQTERADELTGRNGRMREGAGGATRQDASAPNARGFVSGNAFASRRHLRRGQLQHEEEDTALAVRGLPGLAVGQRDHRPLRTVRRSARGASTSSRGRGRRGERGGVSGGRDSGLCLSSSVSTGLCRSAGGAARETRPGGSEVAGRRSARRLPRPSGRPDHARRRPYARGYTCRRGGARSA